MYGGTLAQDDVAFAQLAKKVPGLRREELDIHGLVQVRTLPCEAPWLGAFGACLVMITDVRRGDDGQVEFQIGDEHAVPYENGTVWRKASAFYDEWPQ